MKIIKSESNIIPQDVVIDYQIVDVNLNVVECIKDEHTYYTYDTYRFDRNELTENEPYKIKIEALIRCKYSINDEMAILRQKDTKIDEYNAYNTYVEQCKVKAQSQEWRDEINSLESHNL